MKPTTMKFRIVLSIGSFIAAAEPPVRFNCDETRIPKNVPETLLMSQVEDVEHENGSGSTNGVAEEWNKSSCSVDQEKSTAQVEPKTSATLNSDAIENIETRVDKAQDDDTYTSFGDICRICHMGRYFSITENRPLREPCSRDGQHSGSFVHFGPLISACKCRGTVALVHVDCLERWLTESGRERCELCGHKYATKRVPRYSLFRSVVIWFHTVIASRQMLLDIGYLVMTTPVAAFSCYVCALALKMLLRNGFYEIPWMIIAMLPTCLLTLIAYWRWIITLGRLHGHRWRRYWRNNFVIRLIPNDSNESNYVEESMQTTLRRPMTDSPDVQERFERWIEQFEGLT